MSRTQITVVLRLKDGTEVTETFAADLSGFVAPDQGGIYDYVVAVGTPSHVEWGEVLFADLAR